MKQKQDRRQLWMARFESWILAREPRHAGKIKWDSAQFYYNSGLDSGEAANKYLASNEPA